jgi:hypothetical protein
MNVEQTDKKQIYLQRVNQLYENIKIWLKDEKLVIVPKTFEIVEVLGRYQSTSLSIKSPTGDTLADIIPQGASVILAEGLIDIDGWLGQEYLAYMVNGGPYSFRRSAKDKNKHIKHFFYPSIEADGWYWVEEKLNSEVHFLNKNSLLQLISQVSMHEF